MLYQSCRDKDARKFKGLDNDSDLESKIKVILRMFEEWAKFLTFSILQKINIELDAPLTLEVFYDVPLVLN